MNIRIHCERESLGAALFLQGFHAQHIKTEVDKSQVAPDAVLKDLLGFAAQRLVPVRFRMGPNSLEKGPLRVSLCCSSTLLNLPSPPGMPFRSSKVPSCHTPLCRIPGYRCKAHGFVRIGGANNGTIGTPGGLLVFGHEHGVLLHDLPDVVERILHIEGIPSGRVLADLCKDLCPLWRGGRRQSCTSGDLIFPAKMPRSPNANSKAGARGVRSVCCQISKPPPPCMFMARQACRSQGLLSV